MVLSRNNQDPQSADVLQYSRSGSVRFGYLGLVPQQLLIMLNIMTDCVETQDLSVRKRRKERKWGGKK